ncbi:MAG: stage III sporulation protein AF [Halanaerobiales bacterium]|nr:stage III sporulation protein AF [Halanaerobiales bacterium]
MIEMLKEWIKNLATIVIFSSILEMLLPNNSLKKYVKVVMGFFILLTILNPLFSLIRFDQTMFYPFQNMSVQKNAKSNLNQGEAMKKLNKELALTTYKSELEQQIRGLLLTQSDLQDVDVDVNITTDGQINAVFIDFDLVSEEKKYSSKSIKSINEVKINIGGQMRKEVKEKELIAEEIKTESKDLDKIRRVKEKTLQLLISFYNLKPETISFQ